MIDCGCTEVHSPKLVVLTGGPGAGKTAVLELVRHQFCRHIDVLPESASILFKGGFRRGETLVGRAAAQRAIFRVQRELEVLGAAEANPAIVLCDRGTVDGWAYWPGPEDYFAQFGTTREQELARYLAVLHLRTPASGNGYNHSNPLRIESALEAAKIDGRIVEAWAGHPNHQVIESTHDFIEKATRAVAWFRTQLPPCCQRRNGTSLGR